jgi:sigma-E factor negative regulatory protein RseA
MQKMNKIAPKTDKSPHSSQDAEALSAWMDGHIQDGCNEFDPAGADVAQLQKWADYHFIGEVMRAQISDVRVTQTTFLARWQDERNKTTPPTAKNSLPQQEEQIVSSPVFAANSPRWRLVAGALAVVLMVGVSWKLFLTQPANQSSQMAQSSQVEADRNLIVVSQQGNAMVRDPELDALLMRHKQLGTSSALQGPAGFLRSATFATAVESGISR